MVTLRERGPHAAAEHGGGFLEVGRDAVERVGDEGEDVRKGVAGDREDQPREGVDVDEVLVWLEAEEAAVDLR